MAFSSFGKDIVNDIVDVHRIHIRGLPAELHATTLMETLNNTICPTSRGTVFLRPNEPPWSVICYYENPEDAKEAINLVNNDSSLENSKVIATYVTKLPTEEKSWNTYWEKHKENILWIDLPYAVEDSVLMRKLMSMGCMNIMEVRVNNTRGTVWFFDADSAKAAQILYGHGAKLAAEPKKEYELFSQSPHTIVKEIASFSQETRATPRHPMLCPISQQSILNPVVAEDGYVYDKASLKAFVDAVGEISPITGAVMGRTTIDFVWYSRYVLPYANGR
jgi:hypothetical protein